MSENSTEKELSMLFKEIDETLKVVGIHKLVKNIKSFRHCYKNLTEEQLQHSNEIIDIVFECFGLSREELFSKNRNLDKHYAAALSAYFLSEKLGLDNVEISILLAKYPGKITQYIADAKRLSENYEYQRNAFEKKKIIEEKIKHYGPRH